MQPGQQSGMKARYCTNFFPIPTLPPNYSQLLWFALHLPHSPITYFLSMLSVFSIAPSRFISGGEVYTHAHTTHTHTHTQHTPPYDIKLSKTEAHLLLFLLFVFSYFTHIHYFNDCHDCSTACWQLSHLSVLNQNSSMTRNSIPFFTFYFPLSSYFWVFDYPSF